MIIRVPLVLQKVIAVIYPLDVAATRAHDPAGPGTSGYSEVFREPIAYNDGSGDRTDSRQEGTVIRIPCQVENMTEEKLKEMAVGDSPVSNIMLVFHRIDLARLSLLDANGNVAIKKGDRIDSLERHGAPIGTTVKNFSSPGLYIHEMRSRSFGFGPDGYDLEFALLTERGEGFPT